MNILRTSALSYVVYADADLVYGVMTCDVCASDSRVLASQWRGCGSALIDCVCVDMKVQPRVGG